MKFKIIGVVVALGAVLLTGCGGYGTEGHSGRGEGSIPIGRAMSDARAVNVMLRVGGSEYELAPSPNGSVYVSSSLLTGPWSATISTDGGWTESFTVSPGQNAEEAFDVFILPASRKSDVTSVTLAHPDGIQLRVGQSIKLKPIITGTNVNGLLPSYWTTGGVGSLNPGGVFRAKAPGTGTLTADVLGFSSTVSITVTP
jgi:hypothetical protein